MQEKNMKLSRRDALRRMAKVSVGIGMGLQLVGVFVPSAGHAAVNAAQGARFSTIGYVSSPAIALAAPGSVLQADRGCYTNGATYNNGNTTYYDKYANGDTCGPNS